MIKSIFIEHFRSCNNLALEDLDNILIMVGKNGVGKTNIFRAISWVASSVGGVSFPNSYYDPPVAISLKMRINGNDLAYSIKCSSIEKESVDSESIDSGVFIFAEEKLSIVDGDLEVNVFERSGEDVFLGEKKIRLKISAEASACAAILTTQPMDEATKVVADLFQYMRGVSYNHLDTLSSEDSTRVVFEKDYLKWMKNTRNSPQTAFETEMHLLDLQIRRFEKYEELKKLLCHLGIIRDLQIQALPTGDSSNPKIYFFHWYPSFHEDESCSWTDLSYGTRRLIKLFVALFYKEDKLFMIEQPEDGIHAGLLHQILPMLREYSVDKQIFIATHSAQVLNKAEPSEVRLVYVLDSSTCARKLDDAELIAATSYIEEEGALFDFLSMIEE